MSNQPNNYDQVNTTDESNDGSMSMGMSTGRSENSDSKKPNLLAEYAAKRKRQ